MDKIDCNNIPNHIAIILDGNGRWAKKRGLPRNLGHRKGALNLKDIAVSCDKLGVKYLTVYCFSTENWSRPKAEVDYLMKTPIRYYKKYKEKLKKQNIVIKVIGRKDRLSSELLNVINELEAMTKDNTGLVLSLCVDYGSLYEITEAVKKVSQDVLDNKINISDITSDNITNYLYTSTYPKLDLLIRTSGEVRISNFLLWQLAYSELYFTDVYWPDFNEKELIKSIHSFQNRDRRFGGLKK